MSDRIAVMFEGKIAQLASPQELYQRPVSRRVASFIGVMNFLDARVTGEQSGRLSLDVTSLGTVDVMSDQAPGGIGGGKISVGIRPEMLTILFDETDQSDREIEGVVVDTNYFGDMTYYDVRLPGSDAPATISMRNTAGRRILREGMKARVGWSPKSLVVLE
jgi:spermidine/putrescine transport system ATP-binding protein